MVRTIGVEQDPAKRIRQRQGGAIRSTRELRGITPEELAEQLDVTVGAVRHWETGRFTPRQTHQVAIAKALGVPWGVLFGLDGAA
jgi:transcriptional regulator with XRE-family HTH domain